MLASSVNQSEESVSATGQATHLSPQQHQQRLGGERELGDQPAADAEQRFARAGLGGPEAGAQVGQLLEEGGGLGGDWVGVGVGHAGLLAGALRRLLGRNEGRGGKGGG